MSLCRVCSVDVTWAETKDRERVPLDDHEQRDYGPGRYRIVANSVPPIVEPISEQSPLRTYVDHRVICQEPRAI